MLISDWSSGVCSSDLGEARTNAKKAGVDDLVSFRNEDLFQTDFKEATVVTLYLLETLNEKLRPKLLAELKPGTRIVSHAFTMGEWRPERQQEVDGRMIYFWRVPARKRSEEHTSELQSLMRISYAV